MIIAFSNIDFIDHIHINAQICLVYVIELIMLNFLYHLNKIFTKRYSSNYIVIITVIE